MRLTLRNILAYINDELSAKQTEELGPKVAGSEVAQQLIEKLNTLARRRRLSAPELNLNQEGTPQDPNYVAAYLDCELTEEEQAVFEAMCFENDPLLAEVAACMQLKTLGEQDAIKVPPTARLRMLHLVRGKESIPDRPPAWTTPTHSTLSTWHGDSPTATEAESLLMLDPLYQKVRGRGTGRLVPLAAAALLLALAGLFYWILSHPFTAQPVALTPTPNVSVAAGPAATKPIEVAATRRAGLPDWVAGASGQLASLSVARPTLPPNLLLAFGHDVAAENRPLPVVPPVSSTPVPAATKPEATAPVTKVEEKPAPQVEKPKPVVKVAIGQYESDPGKEGPLFRQIGPNEWRTLQANAAVLTGEPLLALPGVRAVIALPAKVRLTLVGSLPGDANLNPNNYFLEATGQFNQNPDVETDFTLFRGRIIISRKDEGTARLILRFRESAWMINLLHPDTEVGVEVVGRLPTGDVSGQPRWRLLLGVAKGVVEVERSGRKVTLRDKQGLAWDSKEAGNLGTEQPVAFAWLTKRPPANAEVRDSLAAFHKRLMERLSQPGPSLSWIRVACDEALLSRRTTEHTLALCALAAFEQPGLLLGELENDRPVVRKQAWEALSHYLGNQPGQLARLKPELARRGYSSADQDVLLGLLLGVDQPDPATIERLLAQMKHSRLSIRDQAFRNLQSLVQGEKLPNYDPVASVESRDRAVEAIRKKLVPK